MPAKKVTTENKEEVKETEELYHQNMRFYGKFQDTPKEAQREIQAGRLKGYTDINPMWRIKKLTEIFGPVGFGWWTQNEKFTLEECKNGEVALFCTLELVVVDPVTKEQSHPITGIGGHKFVANEKNGPYCNDEAYKSSYTDALSIACKSLGFSHDIYFAKDRTKYVIDEEEAKNDTLKNTEDNAEEIKTIAGRIQKGVARITANMDNTAKDKFTQEVIVKNIGSPNYLACKDLNKLQKLLDELLEMAKKSA
jgi:hypothetical protein